MHRVQIVRGDITSLHVDAIVNAANELMLGGGGVDGAIHRAAGPRLVAACRDIEEVSPGVRCPTGECRVTPGFSLPARFVIHTVGPVWKGGESGEPKALASCYTESLKAAVAKGATSIAFPAISCGVFGYPLPLAGLMAVTSIRKFLAKNTSLDRVVLVAFDERVEEALQSCLKPHIPKPRRTS